MMKTKGITTSRYPRLCHHTSISWSMTTGCGSHGGRPPETPPLLPRATDRHYEWWVWWAVWSSGGVCIHIWRDLPSCLHSPICTSLSLASSPCGRIPPTFMEANGWSDCAKRRRAAPGRTCAWRCWANSSWWGTSSAGSCCPCASRTTTWRCGTGPRRTWRRRRACGTRCAASCSCRPPPPSSTRRTASVCARPPPRPPRPATTSRATRSRSGSGSGSAPPSGAPPARAPHTTTPEQTSDYHRRCRTFAPTLNTRNHASWCVST